MSKTTEGQQATFGRLTILAGEPYDLGRSHGEQLKADIHAFLNGFLRHSADVFETPFERIAENVRRLEAHIEPEYLEEMRGIADGAGLEYDEVLAINAFVDTDLVLTSQQMTCINIVAFGEASRAGTLIHGRNTDFPSTDDLMRAATVCPCQPPVKPACRGPGLYAPRCSCIISSQSAAPLSAAFASRSGTGMEVFPAAVVLIVRALVISARWAGRQRRVTLERMTAAAEASRIAELEARVLTLEDRLELREAHIDVLESRLGKEHTRKPYPLMERLRIIWLMEYFQIPQRRLGKTLGVSRSSVRRWLQGFEQGKLGRRNEPREPVNKTPGEIAELIWEIFRQNPLWGCYRIAMTLWGLGVFVAASTGRNILLRPKPARATPSPAVHKQQEEPRQILARYPNHVWSVDRTRVWRWGIWPTWVLVGVDHCSRMVTTTCPLEGPNAGWVTTALESAFARYGAPKHIITDQEGVFISGVFISGAFAELLRRADISQRFGAVGQHGSIAVTERVILTHYYAKVLFESGDLVPGATSIVSHLAPHRYHSSTGGARYRLSDARVRRAGAAPWYP